MKYEKNISELTIRNIALIEGSRKVVADVEKTLCKDINELVQELVSDSELDISSDSVFDFYGEQDDIYFGIVDWEYEPSKLVASYFLSYGDESDDDDLSYLTHILGEYQSGATLRLGFRVDYAKCGLRKVVFKKLLREEFIKKSDMHKLGFKLSEGGENIIIDFHLNKDLVAEEYPDLDAAYDPLREAFRILLEGHSHFVAIMEQINPK